MLDYPTSTPAGGLAAWTRSVTFGLPTGWAAKNTYIFARVQSSGYFKCATDPILGFWNLR